MDEIFGISRFNEYNGARPSETTSQGTANQAADNPPEIYAKSPDSGPPKVNMMYDRKGGGRDIQLICL